MISLRSFVLNPVCLDWISSHVTSHSLWREAGEVAVGQDTKQYFDQFGFDFRKSVMVASGIHSVYHSSNTMKVSVTENKNWGRTHCFDETYEFEKQPTECSTNMKVYPAVVMYISCSSRTSACRSVCKKVMLRNMKKDNNMDSTFTTCPGCNEDLSIDISVFCLCGVSMSPSWYTVNSQDKEIFTLAAKM
ncbi:hypothetical protein Pcinc_014154 [Petrolisthes cinctipes]|uniref:Uncharacterized protein n=1 Tax=Petrolisthes cinctipes TaxID=88211 RepID=A0AAE1KRL5_PETCI|nr:hypothetical protein Pcinc_014154 [Petrolisthes cinctipes]